MTEPSINVEVELAAKKLPFGWVLSLCVEQGAAWIEMHDPIGDTWNENEMDLCQDDPLACRINRAVDVALEIDSNRRKEPA